MVKLTNQQCIVALGANLPSASRTPVDTLRCALKMLEDESLLIKRHSRWYTTPAYPAGSGPDFVNAVVRLDTALPPTTVLERLHQVEARLGRVRGRRWDPRVCDLDLIALGDLVLPSPQEQDRWRGLAVPEQAATVPDQLILPHPRLQDRAFVLVPMSDVAPNWTHPRTGRTVAQMLRDLPLEDVASVREMPQ